MSFLFVFSTYYSLSLYIVVVVLLLKRFASSLILLINQVGTGFHLNSDLTSLSNPCRYVWLLPKSFICNLNRSFTLLKPPSYYSFFLSRPLPLQGPRVTVILLQKDTRPVIYPNPPHQTIPRTSIILTTPTKSAATKAIAFYFIIFSLSRGEKRIPIYL